MIVTFALWWLFIGACVWVLLDAQGIFADYSRDAAARGRPVRWPGLVMATAVMIVAWPWFAWVMLCKLRKALRGLAQ